MGGLACAHELRSARVNVGSTRAAVLWAARRVRSSSLAPDLGAALLPGEHGFRFYPGFYRHVIASMREIPTRSARPARSPEIWCGPRGGVAMGAGIVRRRGGRARLASSHAARTPSPGRRVGWRSRALPGRAPQVPDLVRAAARPRDRVQRAGRASSAPIARDLRRRLPQGAAGLHADDGGDGRRPRIRPHRRACVHAAAAGLVRRGAVDRTMMGPTTDCWIEPWRRQLLAWGVEVRRPARVAPGGAWPEGAGLGPGAGRSGPIEADAFVLAVPAGGRHAG